MFKSIKNKIHQHYMYVNYKKMLPFIKPYWKRALLAILITIPIGMLDAVVAWILKPYMDNVLVEKSISSVSLFPILVIVFTFFQSALNYSATYLNAWVGAKITNDLKKALFNKLMRHDAAYFDKTNSGTILLRFSGDVDTSCSGLLSNLKMFTTRLFSSIGLICVLIYTSWQLSIVALVFLFGGLYPLSTIRRRIKKLVQDSVIKGASMMTHYNESFQGNRVISSYNLYDMRNKNFENDINAMFKISMKMTQKTGMMSPLMHFIISFGVAGVIYLGSYLIVKGIISSGDFVAFIVSLLMLYSPLKSIGKNLSGVQTSIMAMERMFEILEMEPDVKNSTKPRVMPSISKQITYENVWFEYEKDKPVLKGIDLTIPIGKTVAFVGNSGGGKTTISQLLPRFYNLKEGKIKIDGIDIKRLDLNELRDRISIVFQDNFLFSGTIRQNILMGRPNASVNEVHQAVESACLSDFVASLEKGLDTEIGERGVLLSGGQKQRIAIARAFLKNAPIVILDEATSALDNKSEKVVQQAIDNLMKNRTVLVIAHRLSTVQFADKIVVVNDGRIVEEGSHNELIKKDGEYASLYKSQFNSEK